MQNMETVATLSELLKLAGIKEFKPPSGKQNRLNKHSKKRKSSYKITTVDKHRNTPADFFLNESKKSQNHKSKKIILENSTHSSPVSNNNLSNLNDNKNKSAEDALYVSLDFIKDCQKYKQKFRNPKVDLQSNNQEKRQSAFSTDQRGQVKRKESQNLLNEYILSLMPKEKEVKNSSTYEDMLFNERKFGKLDGNEIIDLLNKPLEDIKTSQKAESLINKPSLRDVARIDKKYLDSVQSLATNPEQSKMNNTEKGEIGKEMTKKSIGKSSEIKNKELKMGDSKNEDKIGLTKSNKRESLKDKSSARIVRDSTKSEVRIQFQGNKNFSSLRNSEEIKIEKEIAHFKSELNDGRKKRKPRKKIINSNNKEKIEIPFSSEISKAKDVKELWRRETQKKSENSLTSHSSCTIPENDENPKWKNFGLQSYRILHKLVEEEINKISKKSENKNNTKEVKNTENNTQKVHENKPVSSKESLKSKNVFNKLKLPTDENPSKEKEAVFKKKKLMMQAENLQNNSNYEGEKNKCELLSTLDGDSVKTSKGELKLSEETFKKSDKVPEQTIDNWSILNRLEQAFLALGGSDFLDENALKTKQGSKNNSTQNSEFPQNAKISKNTEEHKKIKSKTKTTLETPSNKRTLRPLPKARISSNESVLSNKKTENVKLASKVYSSLQSKEENKRKELCKTEIKTIFDKKVNAKESLTKKKTFSVISQKGGSITEPQNPNIHDISDKTENNPKSDQVKSRLTSIAKQESKNTEKKILKNKPLSRSKSNEKREEKTRVAPLKNQVRPPSNEKAPQSHENYKSGIPKPIISTKQKFKVEEVLLQKQTSEKKELSPKKPNEKLVKERSILSVHENRQDREEKQVSKEKLQLINEKTSFNYPRALESDTGDMIMKNANINFENLFQKSRFKGKNDSPNIYRKRARAYEQQYIKPENTIRMNSQSKIIILSKQNSLESGHKLTSTSSLSQTQFPRRNHAPEKHSEEFGNLKNLSLWERDIRRYREIVKDIMSQYKRIDGFLQQSERLTSSSSKSNNDLSAKVFFHNEESSKLSNESRDISLQEYRKKIMTEYKTLPFFEYKQLQTDEGNNLGNSRKRNLSVVSDIRKEMDFDVKDYQPKIKKVLDSQLYIDKENLFIQKDPQEKFENHKLSLQEMLLNHDKCMRKNHCLKSYSLPKTFLTPAGEIYSVHSGIRRQKY